MSGMTTTYEHSALRFLPEPNEKYESTSIDAGWRRHHVRAVADYIEGTGRRDENAILSLMDGIETYIGAGFEWNDYVRTPAVAEMLSSFVTLLNFDLGRLDAGTLDRWASDCYRRIGWNRDLGQFEQD